MDLDLELVTGHSGTAHVSSADAAALNRGIFGDSTVFLESVPEITMTDANTFTVSPFNIVSDGYHSNNPTSGDITIQSGAQTGFRKDAIMLRYENDGVVEASGLVYVAGETASTEAAAEVATTPYVGLKVSEGADIVDVPLFVITLDGLTPTAAFAEGIDAQAITSLAELRDSVSPTLIGSTQSTSFVNVGAVGNHRLLILEVARGANQKSPVASTVVPIDLFEGSSTANTIECTYTSGSTTFVAIMYHDNGNVYARVSNNARLAIVYGVF